MQYICKFVPISDTAKRSPGLLFWIISNQIWRNFLVARFTLIVVLAFALTTMMKAFTSFWDWRGFDGYTVVLALFSLYIGAPIVQTFEEFFHAIVPVAKGQPDWLNGMLVSNLYRRGKKDIGMFLFVSIHHQGDWRPLDSFHTSAAGPLGLLAITAVGFVVVLTYGWLSGSSILYPLILLAPLMLNGFLSLVPIRTVVTTDGANMISMAQQAGLSTFQIIQESFRSVILISNYLVGTTRPRFRHILILIFICAFILWTAS